MRYLLISGWAAIIATFLNFGVSMTHRMKRLSEINPDGEFLAQTFAAYTMGFSIELPLTLTIACLCLMAGRVLTYKQQTIPSVFE